MFDPSEIEHQNPYSQRSWWNCISAQDSLSSRCRIYEQSLSHLPGSYKLWYNYLLEVRTYVDCNPSLEHYLLANTLHERALTHMYLMPQIWLDYLDFLIAQGHITKTRRVFDLALQRLPLTQHDLIWDSYLFWAQTLNSPDTSKGIFTRYLQLTPSYIYDFIDFLIKNRYIAEAVSRILEVLQTDDTPEMWSKLAKLLAENPGCVENSAELLKNCGEKMQEKGRAWELVAEFYLRQGDIDAARGTYEQALKKLESVQEFSMIFAAYTQLEEEIMKMNLEDPRLAEEAMDRLEELLERREILMSDVKLRENPNDVEEWVRRAELFEDTDVQKFRVYAEALVRVDPLKARGHVQKLWIGFARLYEKSGDLKNARTVYYKGTQSTLKKSAQIAEIWEEWVEMEIRHRHYTDALKIVRKICNAQYKYSKEPSIHQEVSTNNRLWALYVDLEESLGSLESTKEAYERMITNKFANVHALLNYVIFLQENQLWEESFKVYEQGINKFTWPHVCDIWVSYLNAFTSRYGAAKLERARDLFEQVLATCPKDKIRIFYLMYVKLEEEFGLGNHIIEIFEKAVRDVLNSQKPQMFLVYMQKICDFFGIMKMRTMFEAGFEIFTIPQQIIDLGIQFANIEKKLGEIDRVRSLYQYISQFCDPRKSDQQKFWSKWNEFEIYHGNEDTYREMMRIQRTAKFNAAGVTLFTEDPENNEENDDNKIIDD